MANNAEILAQLEKLAEAQERDVLLVEGCWHVAEALGARGNGSRIMKLVDSFTVGVDFSAILAAFKRLVKIEEAAKRFYWANRLEGEAKGAQLPRDRIIDAECATMSAVSELTAALKEGKRGGGGE